MERKIIVQNASGIAGIVIPENESASSQIYYMLHCIQHRGPDACGIASANGERIFNEKGLGMLSEIFKPDHLEELKGFQAIGQVRMKTPDDRQEENLQPVNVRAHQGPFSLVCSGMLLNNAKLRSEMMESGLIFQGTSDAEILAHLIQNSEGRLIERIEQTVGRIQGSITFLVMTKNTMYAYRSLDGIRSLYLAKLTDGGYAFCSESAGFGLLECEEIREVRPGELIILGKEGYESRRAGISAGRPCAMETVYYSRADSDFGNLSVYEIRKRAGEKLAEREDIDADIVIGVPDTATSAAAGFAEKLKKPYEMGIIKNRYIGSTFVRPTKAQRDAGMRVRLNAVSSVVKGKSVYLVDDSIQKGDTARRLCQLLREAGAKEVHLRIASPIITSSCFHGTEFIDEKDLCGSSYSEQEMCQLFQADSLRFLSVEDFEELLPTKACLECFGRKQRRFRG
ncbi:amidophosphoribosyltransferase [Ileibacterium valens]|uniref:Amidophosphoribosyltransferase n=2 Tax=Ileibacterium valens TaxID=1862668 RepID=A0A1U7NJ44_9FIRM|nr:amidophosphoribosyltransferase [Ileibacterium valens]OLU36422.1 amidophosphoribosyltransferase [Erysipelotrichaceae bacterium NYU-BL-E8]OLU41424.1 amidophosphoribosyltransferase [Erysipelotrichaceae bacterium NYU-BL-F16]OLU43085.1 amidophosphoribosyltransferase [Ileibacterium valens]